MSGSTAISRRCVTPFSGCCINGHYSLAHCEERTSGIIKSIVSGAHYWKQC